jgi:hypothetical protein
MVIFHSHLEEKQGPPFYLDYRKLNDITKKACFALSRIGDTLDLFVKAKWFSTLVSEEQILPDDTTL